MFFLQKPNQIEINFRLVHLKKTKLKFWVRSPMDIWSIKETFLDDFYHLMEKDDKFHNGIIIDIGAGIGEFAIQSAFAYPNCKIYGFEPYLESYALFEKNIALNDLKNVTAVDAAIASVSGNFSIDTSSGNPLKYRMQTSEVSNQTIKIRTIQLIDYMDQHGIQICDILKLDCEGGEYDILLSLSTSTLIRFKKIVMEYHDTLTIHNHNELVEKLTIAGFQVDVVSNQVHADLGYIYARIV
jgi:FkbM family methyltransferase